MNRRVWAGLLVVAGLAGADAPKDGAGPLAAKVAAVRAEYEAAKDAASKASEKGKTDYESWKLYSRNSPDEVAFSKRMVDLAATDPKDPAARDALLWVLDKPGMGPGGPYSDEVMRAALLLLRHHADDPEVARVCLQLNNVFNPGRDLLLQGVYARAKGREQKGMARLALGLYLAPKARYAEATRLSAARGPLPETQLARTYDDTGKLTERTFPVPAEDIAYRQSLACCDPDAMRDQARRLLDEVVKDYADVPFVTRHVRMLEQLVKDPNPTMNGRPLTPAERSQLKKVVGRKKTLGEVAKAKLDELETIVEGKPAPPIDGNGMDGRPLRLSDYRGKVVVLVFWGTWCGPCMAAVPHEREMAEKFKGRPFAILGVDCDEKPEAALAVMAKEGITWPNWNDGEPGQGPIVKRYHVRGYPSTFVIDPRGVIRHIDLSGSALEKAVETLLAEAEGRK